MIGRFVDRLFEKALAEKFLDCEVYYAENKSFQVKIFKGEINEYKNAYTEGVSFRGSYNGKVGYAYSEKTDFDVIDFLIDGVKQNAEVLEDSEEKLYGGDESYPEISSYNEELNNITVEQKIEMAKLMEKTAYEADARVKSVDYCVLSTVDSSVYIINTLGLEEHTQYNCMIAYVNVIVEQDGQVKTGYEYQICNSFEEFNPEDIAKKAVDKAVSYLGATSIKSGHYPTIFDKDATISLLSAFLPTFFAENVQKGFSLLKGKLDQKIASDVLTICDDGILENAVCLSAFDSEGVAVKNKTVIENGTLKTYLYNLKSAAKDSVKSTGNGFKASFKSSVSTSATNFYIKPSNITPDELIKQMGAGVIITELGGIHAGTNAISGDFSLLADGYMVEDGKIVRSVEQITIAGNFFELLFDTVAVANDLRFGMPSGHGIVGSPSIRVKEMAISGL